MAVQSLRQIKDRIRTVGSVKKVMHAMEVISSTKLKGLERQVAPAKRYFAGLEGMVMSLLADNQDVSHPFIETAKRASAKKALFVVGSDMGLCGSYNVNVMRVADEFIARSGKENVIVVTIGRKALNHFKRKRALPAKTYEGIRGKAGDETAEKMLNDMMNMFLSGEVGEVHLAYMHMESASKHAPVVTRMINVERKPALRQEHIYEPDPGRVLEKLLPAYLGSKIRLAFLEAYTSENSMRAVAMKEATSNAEDLLEGLTLTRNKMRQAGITAELTEIVSSKEAIK
jgi:F-type H+-transporting ATPase subunit gamma